MGAVASALSEMYPPKSKFAVEDIPDLSGKIMIVTGANTGIGKETVKALLQHDAKIYMACRTRSKAEDAIRDLMEQTGKEAHFLQLDLADLKSIKAAAEEFQSKEKELHVLFNNAGVMMAPTDQLTAQGYDLQFGTNNLGHFYFTKLLLPTLLSTAENNPPGTVRIVNTSSFAHRLGNLDFNTFKDGPARRKKSPMYYYNQSKFGNVVFANELARRYGDKGIVSTSLHPGSLRSDLQRHMPRLQKFLVDIILLYPVHFGPLTQLWAGTSVEGADFNGKYLVPWARIGKANPKTEDPGLGKALWEWFEEQVQDV
ncbi:hypothetical protein BDQ12DRAFT_680150 [Crucibulum laeve]|uniref:NAD(P)-binding protein n=1 Tax=Crucibulum laeve TaxID=68775 RepID=A0A5C3M841_9AGAR|nr:hypothetical protein BDQ12DRAFT_680150 [Crucibulum laeve]